MSTIRLLISALVCTLLIACGEQQSESALSAAVTEQEAPVSEPSQAAPVARDFEIILTVDEVPEGTRVYIYEPTEVEKPAKVDQLALASIENGEHRYSGQVTDVRFIWLDLVPADSKKPLSRLKFMLEPGVTKVQYKGDKTWRVDSGPYNQLLVGSYMNNPEYWEMGRKANEEVASLYSKYSREDMTVEERREVGKKAREIRRPAMEMRTIPLEDILNNHPDPVARLGAFQILPMTGITERLRFLAEIGEDMADHRGYKAALWSTERSALIAAARSKIKIGTAIPDFSAKTLSGDTLHLKDVRKDNKYVLVEFWASWCGPCRGEIPHMKTAYERFKDQGFEILSFSVDDDREEWEEASIEEELPWLDISDLLAYSGPIPKAFGVLGVPKNYLIEASSGKIIDMDLRQEALDHRLEELLGEGIN